MPWKSVKSGSGYDVVKKGSGKIVAHHPDKESADAQVRALYANYHGEGKKEPPKKHSNSAKANRLKEAAARRIANRKAKDKY